MNENQLLDLVFGTEVSEKPVLELEVSEELKAEFADFTL